MRKWNTISLRDISTHIKDGTHGTHARVESGVPLLSAKNIGNNGRLSWNKGDDLVSESDYSAITATFTPKTDDILLTVVGSIGRTAIFDGSRVAFQRSVAFVRCNNDVLPKFLYQAIASADFTHQLERRCNVTAQAGLYLGELAKCRITLPPYEQQRKIATILTGIDIAIEKTEALIAKYQQIKAGLMHDLFTRGVLPNGQLRPPHSEALELYQETAIGWIPREWRIATLGECISGSPKNGYSPREVDTWEGIYVLGLGCLTREGFEAKQLKNAPRAAAIQSGALLRSGDFLISRANTPELVGLCGVYVDLGSPAIYPDLMMRLTLLDFIDSYFLEAQLLLPATRSRLTALAVGTSSSMAKLNAASIKQFQVFVPPLDEQRLALKKLKVIQQSIHSYRVGLSKLRSQKLGLMQDLLTGKVPVLVDEPEAAHA